jgi:hypothetical protein
MRRFSYFRGEIDCQGGQWFSEGKFLLFNAWGMTNFGGKIMSLGTLIICKTKASLWGIYTEIEVWVQGGALYICIDSEMKVETNKRHPKSWKVKRNSNHLKCQASTTRMPLAPSIEHCHLYMQIWTPRSTKYCHLYMQIGTPNTLLWKFSRYVLITDC